MNSWCESCARKNLCYVINDRPKCFVPITNTASGTPYKIETSSVCKDEPQKKEVEWVYNKREGLWYPYSNGELLFKDEPQTEPLLTCSVNGRPYTDCCNCEYFKCTADEPQTDDAYAYDEDDWYDKAERSE